MEKTKDELHLKWKHVLDKLDLSDYSDDRKNNLVKYLEMHSEFEKNFKPTTKIDPIWDIYSNEKN